MTNTWRNGAERNDGTRDRRIGVGVGVGVVARVGAVAFVGTDGVGVGTRGASARA